MDKKGKKVVLIVEDEINNYLLLKEMLSRYKVEVLHATNGKEAVETVKKGSFIDLVLMDIKMPVMDGYEATKLIKKHTPGLPVVAQTAHAYPEEMKKAEKSGCEGYLIKPIDLNIFFGCMNKYLA